MTKDILLMSPEDSRIQMQSTILFLLPLLPPFWSSLRLIFYCCYCWVSMYAFVRKAWKRHLPSFSSTELSDLTQLGHPFSFYFPRGSISSEIKHSLPDGPFLVRKFTHEHKHWQMLNQHPAQRGALAFWVLGILTTTIILSVLTFIPNKDISYEC